MLYFNKIPLNICESHSHIKVEKEPRSLTKVLNVKQLSWMGLNSHVPTNQSTKKFPSFDNPLNPMLKAMLQTN